MAKKKKNVRKQLKKSWADTAETRGQMAMELIELVRTPEKRGTADHQKLVASARAKLLPDEFVAVQLEGMNKLSAVRMWDLLPDHHWLSNRSIAAAHAHQNAGVPNTKG